MNSYTKDLLTFISQHGFTPWLNTDGSISFLVPFTNAEGNSYDEVVTCEPTLTAVREALEY
jgi:hypothetical protein